MKKAFIAGVSGQGGYWLSRLLLEKEYEVHGLIRRCATPMAERTKHLDKNIILHEGDLCDPRSLNFILSNVQPDVVFNLAAQSHVGASWQMPFETAQVTGMGMLYLLEAVRNNCSSETRVVQMSSSEMFGNSKGPQNEQTPLQARSPYAAAKIFAHQLCRVYRESYKMFVATAINFNFESHMRGEDFVTRKITKALARIAFGLQEKLELGNLSAWRDWTHAKDTMRAVHLISQADDPDDFVVGSGETQSVEKFLDMAIAFCNGFVEEHYPKAQKITADRIKINENLYRPAEVNFLQADTGKIERELGWRPEIQFPNLVGQMMGYDLAEIATHNGTKLD